MTARSHPSIAKAIDVADVRFALPDLAKAEAFLIDFGFAVERSDDRLIARGAHGNIAYLAEASDDDEARFAGFSFAATSANEIEALADELDAETRENGQGLSVSLIDPDGFSVRALNPEHTPGPKAPPVGRNESGTRTRTRSRLAVPKGPSQVLRLGHVVLQVTDFESSLAWYQDRFGLLMSDRVLGPDGKTTVGAFLRCDRGEEVTDHHSLFLMQSPGGVAKIEHAAFEVADFDSLMAGADHLKAQGYEQEWGIGRHLLGAHIFDYWRDPFGFTLEHWTDGDLIDSSDPEGTHDLMALLGSQWGPPHAMLGGGK
ncbi:VOC family protein [Erythrobacter rubeus]|uniref:VOC family protein n=1 Tax=Erythrobacter rubeus TaxID=2760803 RepID=A0ABR8KUH6_9SPHN|nr:VOC family protein [Erythrobacter rubeus]MBD2841886.1 VOC family protein [Erythrobacter rubeus]